ncbi:hypothetical protein PV773_12020 [Mesorhizobium sp. CC13]|uniref:hypothetical protein n=1 Tax=Mesorhizobium sp. CC13 TaxID=3029194 RepID=UPI003265EC73
MAMVMWIGALLLGCGVVMSALSAVYRDQLSNSRADTEVGRTLEPRHGGMRFLGIGRNGPALLLIVVGAIILLFGALA